eukprot:6177627-Pleurochrysis_carterae.AAC.1
MNCHPQPLHPPPHPVRTGMLQARSQSGVEFSTHAHRFVCAHSAKIVASAAVGQEEAVELYKIGCGWDLCYFSV